MESWSSSRSWRGEAWVALLDRLVDPGGVLPSDRDAQAIITVVDELTERNRERSDALLAMILEGR